MTKEQIFQMVQEYFAEEWCEEDGCGWTEFSGKPDVFVKFAEAIYENGYNNGYEECSFDMGDENV